MSRIPVTENDLRAITPVLDGVVSLETVAKRYSARHATMVAATILHLAGWSEPAYRGQFGELLEQLVRAPGVPERGLPQDAPRPTWYAKKSRSGLLAASLKAGLHEAGRGQYARLNLPPTLRTLKANPRYVETAAVAFQEAVKRTSNPALAIKSTDSQTPGSDDFALMKATILNHPQLAAQLPDILVACDTAAAFAERMNELGGVHVVSSTSS